MTNLPIEYAVIFDGNTKKLLLERFKTREEAVRYIQSIEENLKKNDKYIPYRFAIMRVTEDYNFELGD